MTRPPSPYVHLESAWSGATPTSGPFGLPEKLGVWFTLDSPRKLAAFTWYTDARHPNFALFQLFDATPTLIAQAVLSGKEAQRDPGASGWRNVWVHPRPLLQAATPYLVCGCVVAWGANFGALNAGPIVNGHFTVLQDGTTPSPSNGRYDAATDTTGLYNFLDPPFDPAPGQWYAVDVLVEA